MAQSDRPLEANQRPEEDSQPGSLQKRPDKEPGVEGTFTVTIKRDPNEVHSNAGDHRTAEEIYWKRQVRWQRITALATIAAFAAAVWYACLAHQQVDRMQTANNMTALVLRGTQAAVLEISFNTAWEQGAVMLNCDNFGKLAAQGFNGEIEIARESLPEHQVSQKNRYTFGSTPIVIQPFDPHVGGRPWQRSFPMVGFTKAEQDVIYAGREIVTVSGTIRYDNGLGDIITQPFCQIFVMVNGSNMNRS